MSSAARRVTAEAGMKPLVLFLSAALSLILSSVPADAQDQNPQAKNGFRIRVEAPGAWTLGMTRAANWSILVISRVKGREPLRL
jgi:hypothetical protein